MDDFQAGIAVIRALTLLLLLTALTLLFWQEELLGRQLREAAERTECEPLLEGEEYAGI